MSDYSNDSFASTAVDSPTRAAALVDENGMKRSEGTRSSSSSSSTTSSSPANSKGERQPSLHVGGTRRKSDDDDHRGPINSSSRSSSSSSGHHRSEDDMHDMNTNNTTNTTNINIGNRSAASATSSDTSSHQKDKIGKEEGKEGKEGNSSSKTHSSSHNDDDDKSSVSTASTPSQRRSRHGSTTAAPPQSVNNNTKGTRSPQSRPLLTEDELKRIRRRVESEDKGSRRRQLVAEQQRELQQSIERYGKVLVPVVENTGAFGLDRLTSTSPSSSLRRRRKRKGNRLHDQRSGDESVLIHGDFDEGSEGHDGSGFSSSPPVIKCSVPSRLLGEKSTGGGQRRIIVIEKSENETRHRSASSNPTKGNGSTTDGSSRRGGGGGGGGGGQNKSAAPRKGKPSQSEEPSRVLSFGGTTQTTSVVAQTYFALPAIATAKAITSFNAKALDTYSSATLYGGAKRRAGGGGWWSRGGSGDGAVGAGAEETAAGEDDTTADTHPHNYGQHGRSPSNVNTDEEKSSSKVRSNKDNYIPRPPTSPSASGRGRGAATLRTPYLSSDVPFTTFDALYSPPLLSQQQQQPREYGGGGGSVNNTLNGSGRGSVGDMGRRPSTTPVMLSASRIPMPRAGHVVLSSPRGGNGGDNSRSRSNASKTKQQRPATTTAHTSTLSASPPTSRRPPRLASSARGASASPSSTSPRSSRNNPESPFGRFNEDGLHFSRRRVAGQGQGQTGERGGLGQEGNDVVGEQKTEQREKHFNNVESKYEEEGESSGRRSGPSTSPHKSGRTTPPRHRGVDGADAKNSTSNCSGIEGSHPRYGLLWTLPCSLLTQTYAKVLGRSEEYARRQLTEAHAAKRSEIKKKFLEGHVVLNERLKRLQSLAAEEERLRVETVKAQEEEAWQRLLLSAVQHVAFAKSQEEVFPLCPLLSSRGDTAVIPHAQHGSFVLEVRWAGNAGDSVIPAVFMYNKENRLCLVTAGEEILRCPKSGLPVIRSWGEFKFRGSNSAIAPIKSVGPVDEQKRTPSPTRRSRSRSSSASTTSPSRSSSSTGSFSDHSATTANATKSSSSPAHAKKDTRNKRQRAAIATTQSQATAAAAPSLASAHVCFELLLHNLAASVDVRKIFVALLPSPKAGASLKYLRRAYVTVRVPEEEEPDERGTTSTTNTKSHAAYFSGGGKAKAVNSGGGTAMPPKKLWPTHLLKEFCSISVGELTASPTCSGVVVACLVSGPAEKRLEIDSEHVKQLQQQLKKYYERAVVGSGGTSAGASIGLVGSENFRIEEAIEELQKSDEEQKELQYFAVHNATNSGKQNEEHQHHFNAVHTAGQDAAKENEKSPTRKEEKESEEKEKGGDGEEDSEMSSRAPSSSSASSDDDNNNGSSAGHHPTNASQSSTSQPTTPVANTNANLTINTNINATSSTPPLLGGAAAMNGGTAVLRVLPQQQRLAIANHKATRLSLIDATITTPWAIVNILTEIDGVVSQRLLPKRIESVFLVTKQSFLLQFHADLARIVTQNLEFWERIGREKVTALEEPIARERLATRLIEGAEQIKLAAVTSTVLVGAHMGVAASQQGAGVSNNSFLAAPANFALGHSPRRSSHVPPSLAPTGLSIANSPSSYPSRRVSYLPPN